MTPEQVLAYYGTKAKIAEVVGVAHPSVTEWFERGEVPDGRQYQLQLATRGKLKAALPADRSRLGKQAGDEHLGLRNSVLRDVFPKI